MYSIKILRIHYFGGWHSNGPRKNSRNHKFSYTNFSKEPTKFFGTNQVFPKISTEFSHPNFRPMIIVKRNVKFEWTTECDKCFQTLKDLVKTAQVLAHPDFQKPFKIQTDASKHGIGAVLLQ